MLSPREPASKGGCRWRSGCKVELVVIGSDGTITLHLTDGVTVTYGGPDEFEAKAEVIAAILAYADDQGVALVSIIT